MPEYPMRYRIEAENDETYSIFEVVGSREDDVWIATCATKTLACWITDALESKGCPDLWEIEDQTP